MRNLLYRRSQREKHIKRKEYFLRKSRIDNPPHKYDDSDLFGPIYLPKEKNTAFEGSWLPYWIVDHRGKLNKGKIHCSCPLCSVKTRNKSKHRRNRWTPRINYKHSDLQRIDQMNWEEKYLIDF